ncbi:MAG: tetratricopeptide repeat protein [Candidatus Omnitrophota bacterium]
MSLISDALRKTQNERERVHAGPEETDRIELNIVSHKRDSGHRRVIVYGLLGVILAAVAAILLYVSSRVPSSTMKVLNTVRPPVRVAKKETPRAASVTPPVTSAPSAEIPKSVSEQASHPQPSVVSEPKQEEKEKAMPVQVLGVEWVEEKPDRLIVEVKMSGKAEYQSMRLDGDNPRIVLDLPHVQSGAIAKDVSRLNVRKVRGARHTPEIFRLVFELDALNEYKVYPQGNSIFVAFSGTSNNDSKPKETKPKETKSKEKTPTNPVPHPVSTTQKIKNAPETPTFKEEASIDAWIKDGDRAVEDRDFLAAVDQYKKALNGRRTPDIYHKLYTAYSGMNNAVLARAYLDEGLKHFPDHFQLNKDSATLYIREKDFQKALVNIKKGIEKNAGDYHLLTYMGLCYFHLKDYPNALENFQKSLEIDSDAVENYYYIGLIFDNKADYQKALNYYQVFLKLNREDKNFKHKAWMVQRVKALQDYLEKEKE